MKNTKGITLISLIITIIILLILAGITIGQLTGNGLFQSTKEARNTYSKEQAREKIQIIISGYYIEDAKKATEFIPYVQQYVESVEDDEYNNQYIIENDGYVFLIDKKTLKIKEPVEIANGITPKISIKEEIDGETKKLTIKVENSDKLSNIKIFVGTTSEDAEIKNTNNESEVVISNITPPKTYYIKATGDSKGNNGETVTKEKIIERYEVKNPLREISADDINVYETEEKTITVTTTPNNGEELVYKSNNTNIATVDESGKVKGIAKGTTTIEIRGSKTTDVSKTITVTVSQVQISAEDIDVEAGTEITLSSSITTTPTGYESRAQFESDDTDVVSIDENGTATVLTTGTANITVTIGTKQTTFSITGTVAVPTAGTATVTYRSTQFKVVAVSGTTVSMVATSFPNDKAQFTWNGSNNSTNYINLVNNLCSTSYSYSEERRNFNKC